MYESNMPVEAGDTGSVQVYSTPIVHESQLDVSNMLKPFTKVILGWLLLQPVQCKLYIKYVYHV